MDADYLTNLVLATGVVVALVASFLAAPDATRHVLWAFIRREAAATGRTIAEEVRRANLRLRGRGRDRGRVVQLSGTASLGVGASVTASGTLTLTLDPDASVRDRVKRLEQHVAFLNALHEQNKQAIAKEAADRQEAVRRVTERIEQETAAIRGEIAEMERSAQLVDARAVPVIVIGIVLTSIPDVIAQSAAASGLVIAVALISLQLAWTHFWASAGRY